MLLYQIKTLTINIGLEPHSTYLAPEHTIIGRAMPSSDVFSFGAFLLEVACGGRPIEPRQDDDDLILVDWVVLCWNRGNILEAVDPNIGIDFVPGKVELVLKLGLFCSHSEPSFRPTMRQILLFLDGVVALPELSSLSISSAGLTIVSIFSKLPFNLEVTLLGSLANSTTRIA
nr:L-type lectin-domain containing receptor kinase IV.1-like [Solanum lycopersicum]